MFTNETITISRQDGKLTDALSNKHGEPTHDFFKPNGDEFWFLTIAKPEDEDGYQERDEVVGIYLDPQDCKDAADALRDRNFVPQQNISAAEYLEVNGEPEKITDEKAFKELHAIQYINGEHI